jgi:hypothetical protein
MAFTIPQIDIDVALAIENSVKPDELELYLECMNGVPMSKRKLGDPEDDIPGRSMHDGCILSWVFVRCNNKLPPVVGNTFRIEEIVVENAPCKFGVWKGYRSVFRRKPLQVFDTLAEATLFERLSELAYSRSI